MKLTLKQFYTDINSWVESDCPSHNIFVKEVGLCANIFNWVENKTKHLQNQEIVEYMGDLTEQQKQLFREIYDDDRTPFNNTGITYSREVSLGILYSNPLRLQWIKDHMYRS